MKYPFRQFSTVLPIYCQEFYITGFYFLVLHSMLSRIHGPYYLKGHPHSHPFLNHIVNPKISVVWSNF